MSREIPIFDSITHPTLNGNWVDQRYNGKAEIKELIRDMSISNVKWAFAVGMKGIGDYDEEKFLKEVKKYPKKLYPIAFFDFDNLKMDNITAEVKRLKQIGYVGIKIHPRISNLGIGNKRLVEVVKAANKEKLAVLFCTYFYDIKENSYLNNLDNLQKFLFEVQECKIILLHSGSVRLLEMMEIARAYKNVLLDLSLTLCKYEGSSLDLDIKFMFEKFDRRICIGSDHPEFSSIKLRERFQYFSEGLEDEKKINIAYKNLKNYLYLGGE